MDRYNRVWRDPKSPLTPLTPRTTQMFNFDNTSDSRTPTASLGSLKPNLLDIPRAPIRRLSGSRSRTSRSFSQDFLRLRSVFSPNAQSTTTENSSIKQEKVVKQEKREFKRSSPVEQPTLSPRVRSLLNRTGNTHLTNLFARQEIDISVLIQMTLEDLESLGIRGAKELKLALDLIKFAKNFFKK
ncbi:uncharacterized protein LOC133844386 [Drosophila sulfurigaster albostrigata]|uniref:uncharacterized protein LOC133844386 n=1 Tax=Drosophila sulfurigaster albostrigata TaxID=89887 RepID=UPI002D21AB86|nr:uncharacterized protein LOC133844386 [Drosophila sulfurigaster albostrigata]